MSKVCFGVDIGGTTVKCGLFTIDCNMLEKTEISTDKSDQGKHILNDIKLHLDEVLKKNDISWSDVAGIGMGIPGSVRDDGVVNKCVNLGWGIFNVSETMEKISGVPVKSGNDANMAALGEYYSGEARGCSSMVMVTLGTGVGGGIILGGIPVNGYNGAAGEIGHIPVVENETKQCSCGKKGCLEQVASATGIVRVALRMLKESDEPSSLRKINNITAKDVFDAAKENDLLAVKIAEYVCRYLAKGLACTAGVIDPECFVVGGGVSKAGTYLTELTQKYYKELVFHPSKNTKIVLATLGNDAGMYGAARLFINSIK